MSDSTLSRRALLRNTTRGAAGCAVFGLMLGQHVGNAKALPPQALRPPGALSEDDFLAACVRCGLCVRACPYDILKLAGPDEGTSAGTPFFEARTGPCEMCDDIPCVPACPTGALDRNLDNIDDSDMGLAVLSDHETCLNFLGLRCDVCYRVCPLIDEAISLDIRRNLRSGHHALFIPVVHSDKCTGCGKCEQACVLPEAAIKVMPRRLAKGASAGHYRLGWEEKRKAEERGEKVIPDLLQLPSRAPEGMDPVELPFKPATPFGSQGLFKPDGSLKGGG
uniref:Ferredoxin-type protein napG homolog n=1 Tax=Magnetococcus massalia (strain MO-1) TaxID=451514 RepID=A0A1S7LHN6_MAGMO|nr:Ferredoxin-type protein napG homolog [Candidatus Magnetococcus massalia]